MRKENHQQMPLTDMGVDHPRARELKRISRILDENPNINKMVLQDLTRGTKRCDTGAGGMSAEQVVRAAIVKQMEGCSYRQLAFHIVDSRSYRDFMRIGVTHKGFKKSALCSNIKAISAETLEAINCILMAYGEEKGIEKGREVRIDCAECQVAERLCLHHQQQQAETLRAATAVQDRRAKGCSAAELPDQYLPYPVPLSLMALLSVGHSRPVLLQDHRR